MRWISIFFLCLLAHSGLAQSTKIDSLRHLLTKQPQAHDSLKLKWLWALSTEYLNLDTDSALSLAEQSLELAEKTQVETAIASSYLSLGMALRTRGMLDNAEDYFQKAIPLFEEQENLSGLASCYNNLGIINAQSGLYSEASTHFSKALEIRKKIKDQKGVADCYNNIGIVHQNQQNYKPAIENFRKALAIYKEIKSITGEASSLVSIGQTHFQAKAQDSAIWYYRSSLNKSLEAQDFKKQCVALQYLASTYVQKNQLDSAEIYCQKSIAIAASIKNYNSLLSSQVALSEVYTKQQKYEESEKLLNSILGFEHIRAHKHILLNVNILLSELYKEQKRYNEALFFAEKANSIRDSIFNEKHSKAIANLDANYSLNKKQTELELLHQEKVFEQRWLWVGLSVLTLTIGIVLLFLLQQRRLSKLLSKKNKKIAEQGAEIESQNEELRQNQDVLQQTHLQLDEQHKLLENTFTELKEANDVLTHRLHYSQTTQALLLANQEQMRNFFANTQVKFAPMSIVSGDFYWFKPLSETESLLAMADCTGHGVPGAMMSMLAGALLTQITSVFSWHSPAKLLGALEHGIVSTLKQKEQQNTDGLELSLCHFSKTAQGYKLRYASAKGYMYVLRKDQLLVLPNQRVSIGGGFRNKPDFIEFEQELLHGDRLLLFTDGLIDQQNAMGRSLGSKRLREWLEEHKQLNESSLLNKLWLLFEEHRGQEWQRDDVSILLLSL